MKLYLIYNFLLSLSVSLILTSCSSPEYRTDDAFASIKEEKDSLGDSMINNIVVIQEPKKEEQLNKIEPQDEWLKFKTDIEKKILKNENNIKEFSKSSNASIKTLRRAEGLREDNNNLRRKLTNFEDELKIQKEKFKIELNNDIKVVSTNISTL